jgi:outer membrane immunogenic protein
MRTSTINLTTPTGALSRTESVKQVLDMATARVNNRWGGPVIAKY